MIEEGFLSYNELTFIDAAELSQFTGLPEETADEVLIYAEEYADHMDRAVEEERRLADEAAAAAAEAAEAAEAEEAAAEGEGAGEIVAEAAANPAEEVVSVEDGTAVAVTDVDGDGQLEAASAEGTPATETAETETEVSNTGEEPEMTNQQPATEGPNGEASA
jgi:N utilization substance protein A